MSLYDPCGCCGSYEHIAEDCPLDTGLPTVTNVTIRNDRDTTIYPTPEERAVLILEKIHIDLRGVLKELRTIKRKIR